MKPKATRQPTVDNVLKAFDLIFKFEFYNSSTDHDEQPSGAYIFRPETSEKTTINFDQMETFESDLVDETWFSSSEVDWASVVVRHSVGDLHYEVNWLAGSLPAVGSGIEVVMTYAALPEEKEQNSGANDQVIGILGFGKYIKLTEAQKSLIILNQKVWEEEPKGNFAQNVKHPIETRPAKVEVHG